MVLFNLKYFSIISGLVYQKQDIFKLISLVTHPNIKKMRKTFQLCLLVTQKSIIFACCSIFRVNKKTYEFLPSSLYALRFSKPFSSYKISETMSQIKKIMNTMEGAQYRNHNFKMNFLQNDLTVSGQTHKS